MGIMRSPKNDGGTSLEEKKLPKENKKIATDCISNPREDW